MKISKPTLREEADCVKIQVAVETAHGQEILWYAVDKRYRDYLTPERSDGFVVALLPLALKLGEDIHVEGVLSEKLYYNLSHYYVHVLAKSAVEFKEINICPESTDGSALANEGGVLTGFSAGIDSFCNAYDHYYHPLTPSGLKITHFNFNNVGSHGGWNYARARELFNRRYERLKAFPDSLGMEFIRVDSNLSDLLKMRFPQAHTPSNASVALLFQKLFKRYYYASGCKYGDIYVGLTKDTAYHDPIGLPLLSTETLECVPTGSQYSRLRKIEIVSDMAAARRYLDVCVELDPDAGKNCGQCWKCGRTLLTLELLGKIDHFKDVFDMAAWKKRKARQTVKMLWKKKDPFHAEMLAHARASRYPFPLPYRMLAVALGAQ
jgi:hypothetical protein